MDLADIKQAQQRIKLYVKRTTLEHSETLSKYLGQMFLSNMNSFKKPVRLKFAELLINY